MPDNEDQTRNCRRPRDPRLPEYWPSPPPEDTVSPEKNYPLFHRGLVPRTLDNTTPVDNLYLDPTPAGRAAGEATIARYTHPFDPPLTYAEIVALEGRSVLWAWGGRFYDCSADGAWQYEISPVWMARFGWPAPTHDAREKYFRLAAHIRESEEWKAEMMVQSTPEEAVERCHKDKEAQMVYLASRGIGCRCGTCSHIVPSTPLDTSRFDRGPCADYTTKWDGTDGTGLAEGGGCTLSS